MYDVTEYLDDHPGGDDVILETTGIFLYFQIFFLFKVKLEFIMNLPWESQWNLKWHGAWISIKGKDATDDFEDAGHSKDARDLMQDYCIGELDTSSPAIPELEIVSKKHPAQELLDLTRQYWAVPLAVAGISVVLGTLYLRKKWINQILFSPGC